MKIINKREIIIGLKGPLRVTDGAMAMRNVVTIVIKLVISVESAGSQENLITEVTINGEIKIGTRTKVIIKTLLKMKDFHL